MIVDDSASRFGGGDEECGGLYARAKAELDEVIYGNNDHPTP